MTGLEVVAEGVWLLRFPLRLAGLRIDRNVTVIRLSDRRLVIHSTAPFSADDVSRINSLGEPCWLLDASLFHDSFAEQGRRAFPDLPYLAPREFDNSSGGVTASLDEPPAEWSGEIDVLHLDGVKVNEHVFFHRSSKTLIVCDLLFNFGEGTPRSTRWFARYLMRLRDGIGISFFFRLMIRDRAAFKRSLERVMQWDFERVVVGHGAVVSSNARHTVSEHLARAGFSLTSRPPAAGRD